MRASLLLPALLAFSSAAFALPECALVHKAMSWQRGTLVKFLVEERAESPVPPAGGSDSHGQLLRLTVKSGGKTFAAQCAVGIPGCDPASLAGGAMISFVILDKKEGKTLVFPKPDGHLLCAIVSNTATR
jgi:hypothetical protein